jgi:hypothetical protein
MKPQVQPPVWLPVPRGQGLRFYQVTFPALGTQLDVFSGAFEYPFPWRFTVGPFDDRGFPKGEQGRREQSALDTIVEDAVIVDAVKVWWENMRHEPVEKFLWFEDLFLSSVEIFSIDVGNGDGGFIDVEDAGVADGDTMGVARQIADGVFGIDVGWLTLLDASPFTVIYAQRSRFEEDKTGSDPTIKTGTDAKSPVRQPHAA